MFSSIATGPAKQSVGETITVLSSRLNSATLLEDRRAAILGLRSFAKEYPASVASGALRSLIESLSKDGDDVDTVKVVLETLLMLFSPNPDSPEASDEIALWLADEFTQRQENITALLDLVDASDFYSRLYSLQLLSAILSARTERTEECVLTGIPKLVAILDDRREAIRNEAISLLTYLTPTNPEIQKIVAFQNAFERIFGIIEAEGGLHMGDRVVEDCLILLANLLRLNAPNQVTFRETGCIKELAKQLESTYLSNDGEEEEVATWAQQQRNRNVYALLAIVRLFLVPGAVGTTQNQVAFWKNLVLHHVLQLAFSHDAELPIRGEALTACADIIRTNPEIQESFAELQVPAVLDQAPTPNGQNGKANGVPRVHIIDGLLDLILCTPVNQAFDLRYAACQCLKAWFSNHNVIRLHFLRRAIEGHVSGRQESANVLTTLLQPSNSPSLNDPYRHWFAAVILFHLIYDHPEAKALAMSVTEGDADKGEEVVTSIQTITAHIIGGLAGAVDERLPIGYLMLLIGWLFEDLDGVNDFLGEGSNIRMLADALKHPLNSELIKGLCSMLLGVVYEFSTKDSPITRLKLHQVILGPIREKYVDALNKLRSHPFMRDFEVMPQKLDESGDLPEVFLDGTFVEFFKDNYSRIVRAIDREPGMEISVITNGVQKGISRELVDSLRAQLEEKERGLQAAEVDKASLSQQLGQEQADHKRSRENAAVEVAQIKGINEALQQNHDEEIRQLQALQRSREEDYQRQLEAFRRDQQLAADAIRAEANAKEEELLRQLEYVKKTAESEAARVHRRAEAEMADLRATISRLEVDLMKANKARSQDLNALRQEQASELATLREEHGSRLATETARAEAAEVEAKKAEERSEELEAQVAEKEDAASKAYAQLKEKEEEKAATQSELDDLLMVFGDMEEKVEKYKKRLRDLGETISDDEDNEEEEDEGDAEASLD